MRRRRSASMVGVDGRRRAEDQHQELRVVRAFVDDGAEPGPHAVCNTPRRRYSARVSSDAFPKATPGDSSSTLRSSSVGPAAASTSACAGGACPSASAARDAVCRDTVTCQSAIRGLARVATHPLAPHTGAVWALV